MQDRNTSMCPYSKRELEAYAREVQRRIDECDCEVFLNRSEWHASIILRKFIDSARSSIIIFCGHLNKAVYGTLLPNFIKAQERGVEVRVLTESMEVSAIEVAEGLRKIKAFKSLGSKMDLPHFTLIDGIRYRIETDEKDKSAVVCACVGEPDQRKRAGMLSIVFNWLWNGGNDGERAEA